MRTVLLFILLSSVFSCNNIKEDSKKNLAEKEDLVLNVFTSSPLIVGEKIRIEYSYEGSENCHFISPDFSQLTVLSKSEPSTSTSYSMINGESLSFTKTHYNIDIQASKSGRYIIEPASITCDGKRIRSKEFILDIIKKSEAIESELEALEKGENTNYSDDFLAKVVYEFGPLEFRKEEMDWYVYTINSSYQLTKIPLDSIYKKDMSWEKRYDTYQKNGNRFVISNSSNQYLSNILAAEKDFFANKDIFSQQKIKHKYVENFDVESVKLELNRSFANITAMVWNTKSENVNDFKLQVTISDDMDGKNILSTDTITFNTIVSSKEMKFISAKYVPKNFPTSNLFFFDHKLIKE